MENNITRSFIHNNNLAAVSAVMLDENTLSTDGFNCAIYHFDLCGNLCGCTNTTGAYRRLRATDWGYTALCNSERRVYFLNQCFNQENFVTLKTSSGYGCGCGGNSLGCLIDANMVSVGDEALIAAAFHRKAFLFDSNGRRLTRLCEANSDEILTDFLYISNDFFAMSTLNGKSQTVTVSQNGNIFNGIVGNCHTLRMLISHNGAIYGLFGRCYLQNQIIKIFDNGVLTLPQDCY